MKSDKKLLYIMLFTLFIIILLIIFQNLSKNDEFLYNVENIFNKITQPKNISVSKTDTVEEPKEQNSVPFARYNFNYLYIFTVNGEINNFKFSLPLPGKETEKQYISDFDINPKPDNYVTENGIKIAQYNFDNLTTGQFQVSIRGIATVRTYNIKTARKIDRNISPEKDLSRYLISEEFIESDDASIQEVAKSISGSTKEDIIANTFKFVQDKITYKQTKERLGAKKTLELGYGKCGDISSLMTAILRAKKIPARIVVGNFARDKDTPHSWVEVYYDKYGWVAYDPLIMPSVVEYYGANKKLVKKEKIYHLSQDDIRYIKSAINTTENYNVVYSAKNPEYNVDVKQTIKITPAN